jgi:hypothetical protein
MSEVFDACVSARKDKTNAAIVRPPDEIGRGAILAMDLKNFPVAHRRVRRQPLDDEPITSYCIHLILRSSDPFERLIPEVWSGERGSNRAVGHERRAVLRARRVDDS